MELNEKEDVNDQTRVEIAPKAAVELTHKQITKKRWNKIKNILLGISRMKINNTRALEKAVSVY